MVDRARLDPRRSAAAMRPGSVDGSSALPTARDVAANGQRWAWARTLVRGPESDPPWARPGLIALLVGVAVLYLWDLGASGWANTYYSAAVQAGTKSWKAFFYGSFDPANFITVDKSPGSLWVMDVSARLFGVNSWSILAPQALEGVAAVGVLYVTVKRWFGAGAGLLAGAILALTPVAALMFRYNNPDSLLVLLLTISAYCTVRAIESGETRWLVLAGAFVGFGFLAKMLQALLVLPAFGVTYLITGPPRLRRRLWQLAMCGLSAVAAGGWWVALVQFTPASARPYIGGSQNNSLLNLMFGYNGFGRLNGIEEGSVVNGVTSHGGSLWGTTGWARLFSSGMGAQISWLLPATIVLLTAGLLFTMRQPRTDRTRGALMLWGGWLVVTAAAFSFGHGIIHPYYTVALAPPVGAIIAIGGRMAWQRRTHLGGSGLLAVPVALSAWWAYVLLDRTPGWHPSLKSWVLVGGLLAAAALVFLPWLTPRIAVGLAAVAVVVGLAAPVAYTLDTVRTPHTGTIPSAGPRIVRLPRSGAPPARGHRRGIRPPALGSGGLTAPPTASSRLTPRPSQLGHPTAIPSPSSAQALGGAATPLRVGPPVAARTGTLLQASDPTAEVTEILRTNATRYTWAAATVGANEAAGYQLATGRPVMAIGGFNGTDPTPTLAQFMRLVQAQRVHYFIAGGIGLVLASRSGGDQLLSTQIDDWVSQHYPATLIGGVALYDLTAPVR